MKKIASDYQFGLRLSILCSLILTGSVHAQPSVPVSESLEAYRMVSEWINDWQVPPQDSVDIYTTPLSAVVVSVWVDGKVIGRGSRASLEPSTTLVWSAVSDAIERSNAKLRTSDDDLSETVLEALASRVLVTLEMSDVLVPMSKSEIELPGFGYTPGVLGVGVARGDQLAIAGPESMLVRSTDMTQSAMAIANDLAGDGSAVLKTPQELIESGYKFYRFEPVVLSPPGIGMGAEFVDRGGRVIRRSEISIQSITDMSEKVAEHLIGRVWDGNRAYGLMGTLDPVKGTNESRFAQPFQQGLGAFALLRFSTNGSQRIHRDAMVAGKSILRDLAIIESDEQAPWDDQLGACIAVIALSELQLVDILSDKELNQLRIQSLAVLDGLYSKESGFNELVPGGSQGLVAYSIVRAGRLDPTDRTELARNAISQLIEDTPAPAIVAQMPFLGWAQLELSADQEQVVHDTTLMDMRELVWEHQLRREDLAWMDRDLEGGIVFTSAKTPLPSWLSMRPLAIIATMLGDSRLTPGSISSGELPKHLSKQIEAIRFIRQLCATDSILHLYSDPESAQWGVRMAIWDQRMPVEVDAMALLTLSETSRSLDQVLAKSAAE
ncbi:MAG: hypothetical protein P1U42_00070 [Phycisphaerales bacterium]|nr:hypothetical protein [Phycisphaerales bacterium]